MWANAVAFGDDTESEYDGSGDDSVRGHAGLLSSVDCSSHCDLGCSDVLAALLSSKPTEDLVRYSRATDCTSVR